jgi:hypothetical protein
VAKIKVRPSRSQLDYMRALNDYPGLAIVWNGRGAEWVGTAWPMVKGKLGDPKQATVRKMAREEWIENHEGSEIHWALSDHGAFILAAYGDSPPEPDQMEAGELLAMLERRYDPRQWKIVTEITIMVLERERRIDALAVPLRRHAGAIGFELKVARSDFLRELDDPRKHHAAMDFVNYFYFVTPPLLIKPGELPVDCGLIVADRPLGTELVEAPRLTNKRRTWEDFAPVFKALLSRRP